MIKVPHKFNYAFMIKSTKCIKLSLLYEWMYALWAKKKTWGAYEKKATHNEESIS